MEESESAAADVTPVPHDASDALRAFEYTREGGQAASASEISVTSGGIDQEQSSEEPCPEGHLVLATSGVDNYEVDSPSRGQAQPQLRFVPASDVAESPGAESEKMPSAFEDLDANLGGEEGEGPTTDAHSSAHGMLGFADAEEHQPGDAGSTLMLQQAGRPSRKKFTVDARHTAVFEVISSLLNLHSGAEVQKKFLADVRLLSELNSFLDRPAVSKLIYTWGHLKEAETLINSGQSPGKKKHKVPGMGSAQSELHIADSWMIYKEEVPGFLSSFMFFLRIFIIFGVTESTDPSQFITIPQIEKGAKYIETAAGFAVDISPFINSRSKGVAFGSSQKVSFVTMDTFCKWVAGLGCDEALHSFWRQQMSITRPSTSPLRKPIADIGGTEASQPSTLKGKKVNQFSFDNAVAEVPAQPSVDEKFKSAEEKLLQIASNRTQLLTACDELQEFSGSLSGRIEISHIDRWLVQLFPMLDFAPALQRSFRHLQQLRRQHMEQQHPQKEQPHSKSPNNAADAASNNANNLSRKEFGTLLVSVVFYRRL
jgi:hypothetical protein